MKRGLALGVFDLFHVGHLRYLTYAKGCCDELWVGIRGDALQTPGKQTAPLYGENQRLEVLEGLKVVEHGFVFYELLENASYWLPWLQEQHISVVIVGGDWQGSDRWNHLESLLTEIDVQVVYAPRTEGVSSTELRRFTSP